MVCCKLLFVSVTLHSCTLPTLLLSQFPHNTTMFLYKYTLYIFKFNQIYVELFNNQVFESCGKRTRNVLKPNHHQRDNKNQSYFTNISSINFLTFKKNIFPTLGILHFPTLSLPLPHSLRCLKLLTTILIILLPPYSALYFKPREAVVTVHIKLQALCVC